MVTACGRWDIASDLVGPDDYGLAREVLEVIRITLITIKREWLALLIGWGFWHLSLWYRTVGLPRGSVGWWFGIYISAIVMQIMGGILVLGWRRVYHEQKEKNDRARA